MNRISSSPAFAHITHHNLLHFHIPLWKWIWRIEKSGNVFIILKICCWFHGMDILLLEIHNMNISSISKRVDAVKIFASNVPRSCINADSQLPPIAFSHSETFLIIHIGRLLEQLQSIAERRSLRMLKSKRESLFWGERKQQKYKWKKTENKIFSKKFRSSQQQLRNIKKNKRRII